MRRPAPATGIDIGCGERWLVRALDGVAMTGVDVVPALIEQARRASEGDYRVLSYEEIAAGKLAMRADVAVCNFSLLGKESVDGLVRAATSFLTPGGALIVQTIHPLAAGAAADYRDGWRAGSWAGFSDAFSDPAPWYFRTLASWLSLFRESGLTLVDLREPAHPESGVLLSLILVGENRRPPAAS
ncbi:class I SAM-dependent methyltransferase [Massilia sp. CCM 8734]|uniref:class I SAM-dependent methyltransferase n=1 Tax=Massilia sp. CCM 8734 TaxID=2609283 RepID=UPI0034D1E191